MWTLPGATYTTGLLNRADISSCSVVRSHQCCALNTSDLMCLFVVVEYDSSGLKAPPVLLSPTIQLLQNSFKKWYILFR